MKRFILILLAVWLAVYLASFIIPANLERTGDGFTRGLNRVTAFFGWQIAAGLLALLIWSAGRGIELSNAMRWVVRIPILLAAALFLFVVGVIVWANFINAPPPSAYEPSNSPAPTTEPVQLENR